MNEAAADNLWIVVPAWNEAPVIADVVGRLRARYDNVVVVDDCSRDGTGSLAAAAGAVTIRHPINLGQGAALQTGIAYALDAGAERIVTFDADGQHRVEDIAVLIETQARTGADVVLGSRFLGSAEDIPPLRRWVLKLAVVAARLTSGVRLTDAHNGLRLLCRGAALRLRIRQNRMAHATEIVEQLHRLGASIVEAPVTIVYTRYSLGKGQKLSNLFNILSDLLAARFRK